MIITASYKSSDFLWLGFKVLIAFACLFFIYQKMSQIPEMSFSHFWSFLRNSDLISVKNLCFLLFFTFLNWFFEIGKWKILASKIQQISWSESLKQTLSSLSLSLLTPNRIGEYGAKAYFFEKMSWKKVLILNGIGNLYQLLATLIFGILGLWFFRNQLNPFISESDVRLFLIVIFFLGLILILPWIQKQFKKIGTHILNLGISNHLKVAIYSLLRYLIFSHQFYFILHLMQPDINYLDTFSAITIVYLLSSLIPMLSLFDIVVKGSVAVLVLSWIQLDASIALISILIMWFFNFAIPSLFGTFYILRLKPKWN